MPAEAIISDCPQTVGSAKTGFWRLGGDIVISNPLNQDPLQIYTV
jgi:hypothetical protein